MLFTAMLVDAAHSAFEQRKEAFRSVHMGFAANVLTVAVLNALMVGKLDANFAVVSAFIGHEPAFARDVIAHDWRHDIAAQIANVEGTRLPAALDQGQHLALVIGAPAPGTAAFHVGHESFVRLN